MKFKSELLNAEEISRALKRIAHQITERNGGVENVVILGIANGGIAISKLLADYLSTIENTDVFSGVLNVSNYRDDIDLKTLDPDEVSRRSENPTFIPCDINGKYIVLVDDVLYTGRTVKAAFDELSEYGRAASIQLAVLIDRGHRELPIRADFVGKNIPTSHSETIKVEYSEQNGLPVAVNIYDNK
ncbi:MAG: bifunctional pyr operon transcriptional regulator/uracil phosphoribosyltransferase PyrR [Eubacterium sp.]|jgi:pyrimidine operon attenuation protein/uracil phosphoribosyltransferase